MRFSADDIESHPRMLTLLLRGNLRIDDWPQGAVRRCLTHCTSGNLLPPQIIGNRSGNSPVFAHERVGVYGRGRI